MQPTRGEVWLLDLGMAALRGSPFEICVHAPFLKPGAFLVQGISTHPKAWAIRRIGVLTRDQIAAVMTGLRSWLGLAQV
jgi:mRNA-degrading endonuclease toxin of MazEF toxin-antitoxin module